MKHYVLIFVFNNDFTRVLLVRKKRPDWMNGKWNGIGGKIEENETPQNAALREMDEEIGNVKFDLRHILTFTCPGGTVYTFRAISPYRSIKWDQKEDETIREWDTYDLPNKMMNNLTWLIPLCWADIQTPISFHEIGLGI